MELHIGLKNNIWIWQISSRDDHYPLQTESESDVIYKCTDKTVSILWNKIHKSHHLNITASFVVGDYNYCIICNYNIAKIIVFPTNKSDGRSIFVCDHCMKDINEICVLSKCETHIYHNNTVIELGRRVDAIIHTVMKDYQFFCRHTLGKDIFYLLFSKECYSKDQCPLCNLSNFNPYYIGIILDGLCERCKNAALMMLIKELSDKCIPLIQSCPDILLPIDVINIIIKFSVNLYVT